MKTELVPSDKYSEFTLSDGTIVSLFKVRARIFYKVKMSDEGAFDFIAHIIANSALFNNESITVKHVEDLELKDFNKICEHLKF